MVGFRFECQFNKDIALLEAQLGIKMVKDSEADGNNSDCQIGQSNLIENQIFIHPKSVSPSVLDSPKYLSSKMAESLEKY
ncbi:hypothetical protein TTHERM_00554510 (macronuclear) [Tetrahymena thermophila SB210]|uniref:Uncharacterized protein n=1 Tax=Tetrahymena thermophila (strain SB210) TaxID=312017 RepID=Q22UH4_TETTS|nr:hypothetical protein TTHERM_00554510 [Tetrahymena thermophila SB210]EAR88996.1 hypothetical protein TTHERM_00554510 [Tetrahymena thermophila SB210]|eukprot:XP_001009241.1 hypothetical protein TTHERM_00554510 [Tetrahymena thermophila SB210]